eukprot:UN13630
MGNMGDSPSTIGYNKSVEDPELYHEAKDLRSKTNATSLPAGSWKESSNRNTMAGKFQDGTCWCYTESRRSDHSKAWKANLVRYDCSGTFSNIDGTLTK